MKIRLLRIQEHPPLAKEGGVFIELEVTRGWIFRSTATYEYVGYPDRGWRNIITDTAVRPDLQAGDQPLLEALNRAYFEHVGRPVRQGKMLYQAVPQVVLDAPGAHLVRTGPHR